MDNKAELNPGTVAIVAEPGALTFSTRKEWQELTEKDMGILDGYTISKVFKGTDSVYFLLRNLIPDEHLKDESITFCLVKIGRNEEDKQDFYCMDISTAEGIQLQRNQLTLWD